MMDLTWLEISASALTKNLQTFRRLIGPERILSVAVKGNAYGHGIVACAKVFLEAGADYLCVNALYEAKKLRESGIKAPILVIGYIPLSDLKEVIEINCEFIVYSQETLKELVRLKREAKIHLKIETGTHRQGILKEDLPAFIKTIKQNKHLKLQGISTHFANIEDRINHSYTLEQLTEFKIAIKILEESVLKPTYKHCANSAATMILPESLFNFVRLGIAAFGLWPSEKTKLAAQKMTPDTELTPALSWKCGIAQIKPVKKDDLIGYGCTHKMPHNGTIAVLPVGYYDGYSRALSNKGEVLIQGKRAPVIGRVCMNMIMVDVTHIPNLKLEDEVVLLGQQGNKKITAEEMASWQNTINYEVVTRVGEHLKRKIF